MCGKVGNINQRQQEGTMFWRRVGLIRKKLIAFYLHIIFLWNAVGNYRNGEAHTRPM